MSVPVLLTAFEAFAGRETNISERLVEPLRHRFSTGLVIEVLPVDFGRLRRRIPRLLHRHQPQRWLMLGEAGPRPALHCERIAINLLEGDLPDNRGRVPGCRRAIQDAPDAYFATLDPIWLAEHLRAVGLKATVSHDAGTFACNLSLFLALHHARGLSPEPEVGFIHVPRTYRDLGCTLGEIRTGLTRLIDELQRAPAGGLCPRHVLPST